MATNNRQELMQLIQNASPSQLLESSVVADRFINLYKTIHGVRSNEVANAFLAAEKFHFLKLINDNQNIGACTKLSLYGIFMDVAVSGLSFDPSMKHLYIVPFNTNVGTKQEPKWEKRASLMISPYGELLLRQLQGQIKYADNPVLVYNGDEFRYGTKDSKTIIEHMACIPRKSDNIIACYVKLTRHDDSIDYKVMSIEDVMRLRKFSKDENSKAWTDGLPGMVAAKTIKHAFKAYPKLRVGEFSKLASEQDDTEHEDIGNGIPDYGLAEEEQRSIDAPEEAEAQVQGQVKSEKEAIKLDF